MIQQSKLYTFQPPEAGKDKGHGSSHTAPMPLTYLTTFMGEGVIENNKFTGTFWDTRFNNDKAEIIDMSNKLHLAFDKALNLYDSNKMPGYINYKVAVKDLPVSNINEIQNINTKPEYMDFKEMLQKALQKAKEEYGKEWHEKITCAWYNGNYGNLQDEWNTTAILQCAKNHPNYGHKWLNNEYAQWLQEEKENKKILKDSRYTITKEFTGAPDGPQRVLRFCNEYISSHATVTLAKKAQIKHSRERLHYLTQPKPKAIQQECQ